MALVEKAGIETHPSIVVQGHHRTNPRFNAADGANQ
jgi:hypothetical protein